MAEVTRNRLSNVTNPFQGDFKKVLCVCSAGLLRSPTAAWVLSRDPWNFNTRAVGYNEEYALVTLDAVQLAWADEVVVFDHAQKRVVEKLLDEYGWKRPVHNLNVPDEFNYREEALVNHLTEKFTELYPM
jgi:predicted protein tyrosine phosphatase